MRMKRHVVLGLIFVISCMFAHSQSSPQFANSPNAPARLSNDSGSSSATTLAFSERDPRYRLEPGDAFDVTFDLNPEFNQHVTVQPDGYISLHGIDDVHVSNETVPELKSSLKTAYSKILSDPRISVVLTDFQHPYFIADGQLKNPGKYDLRGDLTVAEGVAIAGGFLDSAKHSQVVLFRRVNDELTQATVINLKKMLNKRDLHEDLHLRPGDMLFVPKNRVSKIMPWLPARNVSAYAASL